jgi:hypothetical protein
MILIHESKNTVIQQTLVAIYRELVKMAEQIGTDKTDESLVLPAPCAPLSTKSLVRNRPTVFYFDVQILYRI